jgi:thiamine kinase-like enzyme
MKDEELEENVDAALQKAWGTEAVAFEQLKGGRNSRVFRVNCADGRIVAAKAYFRSANDRRDRMGCEFRALQLLRQEGLCNVAEPLIADAERHVAIYSFIEGAPVSSTAIAQGDISQVLDLLEALKQIAASGRAADFPPASEACFSVEALFENLNGRIDALQRAAPNESSLDRFLKEELRPFQKTAEEWSRAFCREEEIDPAVEIPPAERTLSPSDFGFHNALRRPDGQLVFLDFEYFGWDDPAKTVCDFLLHPGMDLSAAAKQSFFAGAVNVFSETPKIEARVRAVFPLFGLKWTTILLNEFTLDHRARRSFAVGASGVWSQTAQLEKARRLLRQAMNEYRNFPCHS